jgi:hypothetical protein
MEDNPDLSKKRRSRPHCELGFFCMRYGGVSGTSHLMINSIPQPDSSSRKAQAGSVTPNLADPHDPIAVLQVGPNVLGRGGTRSLTLSSVIRLVLD